MVFKQDAQQGSRLAPLLFCLATALLPKTVLEAALDTEVDQFADDFTLCTDGDTHATGPRRSDKLGETQQDGDQRWQNANAHCLPGSKGDNSKGQPEVRLENITEAYTGEKKPGPVVLGVTFDSQMRFGFQVDYAKKLNQRIYILQALSGRKWGLTGVEL